MLNSHSKNGFQDGSLLNAGQKYCRMEHSAILLTFIKLRVVIKTLFCLFVSDRFTQVLLYIQVIILVSVFYKIIEISLTLLKQEKCLYHCEVFITC